MEAVVAITFPLASIVIVLFLLWNDLLRRRRSMRVLLFARGLMCLALGAVLIFNWMSFRARVEKMPITFVVIAAAVAFVGSAWFVYRGVRGDRGFVRRDEAPLPKIFVPRSDADSGAERQDRNE